ncbi:MAG: SAM-dependent methyltransferase [Firmicutes bacterium]|nr:SAM-dependent methyltransferase [Bacillota bacterium]
MSVATPVPFSVYMERALYGENGYYMTERTRFGRSGDFYTSAQVSPLFGALWALSVLQDADQKEVVTIVEIGCGEGGFAEALLRALLASEKLAGRPVRYAGIDLSPVSRERAQLRLQAVVQACKERGQDVYCACYATIGQLQAEDPCDWQGSWVFGNEVLDALPCDVIAVSRTEIRQLFVQEAKQVMPGTTQADLFTGRELVTFFASAQTAWREDALSLFQPLFAEWEMPEVVTEWSPYLPQFLENITKYLRPSVVTFVDYGGYALDVAGDDRPHGSIRAYDRHQLVDDFLDRPGTCDLTYDVNFTAVGLAFEKLGYQCSPLGRQGAWLLALPDVAQLFERVEKSSPGAVRRALSLFMPGGLGDRFVVCRAVPATNEKV